MTTVIDDRLLRKCSGKVTERDASRWLLDTSLTALHLIDAEVPGYVVWMLLESTTLTELHLSTGEFLSHEYAVEVTTTRGTPRMTYLDVLNAELDDEATITLVSFLSSCPLLRLDLVNNEISDEGVAAFVPVSSLTHLDLDSNYIGDRGAQVLSSYGTLTFLNLRNNHIGDEGARALTLHPTLEHLVLSANDVGDIGAKALASNTTLTRLFLSYNRIGDEGARVLADGSTNNSLLHLALNNNDLTNACVPAFVRNSTLTHLDLSHNLLYLSALLPFENNSSLTMLERSDLLGCYNVFVQVVLDQTIATNRKALTQRRRTFIGILQLLSLSNRDASSSSSGWSALPVDLHFCVLDVLCRTTPLSFLAATPKQLRHKVLRILAQQDGNNGQKKNETLLCLLRNANA